MKKIGILYDNISGNTGDVATGLSLKNILRKMRIPFDELIPNQFNPSDYDHIIIGGGYLLQPSPNFFYDKFKISGKHILNAVGILGNPTDLNYLEDYEYITVRSKGDKEKLRNLNKEVKVIPDTTLLLEDNNEFNIEIKKPSVGIHFHPNLISQEQENSLVDWISNLSYNVYFLPITHYTHNYIFLEKLSKRIKNAVLLPILRADEIFTVIGKFDIFISCSLHGALFSYAHNVPFIAYNYEKIKFFMDDRNLRKYLFSNFEELKSKFEETKNNPPDYSKNISEDKVILKKHIKKLNEILLPWQSTENITSDKYDAEEIIKLQHKQIQHLQMAYIGLNSKISKELSKISKDRFEIKKIRDSVTFKVLDNINRFLKKK